MIGSRVYDLRSFDGPGDIEILYIAKRRENDYETRVFDIFHTIS